MNQEQKDLLIELVRKERMRLTVASCDQSLTLKETQLLSQERDLASATLKSLTGSFPKGISWELFKAGGE